MIPGPKTTLTLQRLTQVSDGAGGMTDTWTNVTNGLVKGVLTKDRYSSAINVSRGREKNVINQTLVYTSHIFFCDYNADLAITEKDRFVYGSRIFDIAIVRNPGEMNHHLEIGLVEIF